jgi:hypothetical protein
MANLGAWPVDPATEVGLFRTELGDLNGTPHEPDDGQADFEFISDVAIGQLLIAYPTSRDAAMVSALRSAAFQLIAAAEEIQVDDIRIKTVERARLMLEYATSLGMTVTADEASTAFNVVGLNVRPSPGYYVPQGQPSPWPGMI